MELKEFLKAFYEYSGKASDIARHLGFAGLATIWIFKEGTEANPSVPDELIIPGILIVTGLAFDLLQYVAGSIIWSIFYSIKEGRGVKESDNIKAPRIINKPIYFFFYGKIVLIGISYCYLIGFLLKRL